jgi:uncharacterized lipoprotein YajG
MRYGARAIIDREIAMHAVHPPSSPDSMRPAAGARRLRAATLLAALAMLAGCAANVTQESAPPASPAAATAPAAGTAPAAASTASGNEAGRRATAARQVRIAVRAAPAVQQDANWPAVRDLWQQALADAAQARGLRVATGAGPTVQIDVQVNGFRYVATGARWALGVFTGNATMDVTASLTEQPGRRSLGSERYQTSSRAMEGIFSAATPKQIEALAARIVESIR